MPPRGSREKATKIFLSLFILGLHCVPQEESRWYLLRDSLLLQPTQSNFRKISPTFLG